jgi:predicted aconitase with swiveling domain
MPTLAATVLISGEAEAPLLRLGAGISFWGGVDPVTGKVIDARHPQYGATLGGKIVALERSIGSSSGSAILLELMRLRRGPAGIILAEADFIVTLGALVAREMGYGHIPVVQLEMSALPRASGTIGILRDGTVRF